MQYLKIDHVQDVKILKNEEGDSIYILRGLGLEQLRAGSSEKED